MKKLLTCLAIVFLLPGALTSCNGDKAKLPVKAEKLLNEAMQDVQKEMDSITDDAKKNAEKKAQEIIKNAKESLDN